MDPTTHPKVCDGRDDFSTETLMGTRKLFWKFTCSPVESEKVLSKHFRVNSCLASAGIISRVSSAYWTMGKNSSKSSASGWYRTPAYQALLTIV